MPDRREFLKQCSVATGAVLLGASRVASADRRPVEPGAGGVLVDTTRCIGCRRCEKACNEINLDLPRKAPASLTDARVLDTPRRMDASAYTVVNRFPNPTQPSRPVFAKFQCMHCLAPACVSACIVGALRRDTTTGAVVYDAGKCIGCRYCLCACPFQVPAYEYHNAFTPQVRKCTFCFAQRLQNGGIPACVQACPMEVMTFGRRNPLLQIGADRIAASPGRYVSHIYGEHEVGGTAWLYLAGIPFAAMGFPRLGACPAPDYTEPIQHSIFKWFLPPLGVYATLGAIWWYLDRKKKLEPSTAPGGRT